MEQPIIRARNKKTGEVFEGTVEEARAKGFSDEFIASKLEATKKVEELVGGKKEEKVEGTAEQEFKLQQADVALQDLEKAFGRGDASNIGSRQDLSIKGNATRFGELGATVNDFFKSLIDPSYAEDKNIYKAQQAQFISQLSQIAGSGTPQEGEAKRLIESMPGPRSTDKEAKAWFDSVRKLVGRQERTTTPTGSPSVRVVENPNTATNTEDVGFKNVSDEGKASIQKPEGVVPNLLALMSGQETGNFLPSTGLDDKVVDRVAIASNPNWNSLSEEAKNEQRDMVRSFSDMALASIFPSPRKGTTSQQTQLPAGNTPAAGAQSVANTGDDFLSKVVKVGEGIENNTPRAVLGRMQEEAGQIYKDVVPKVEKIINSAKKIAEADVDVERQLTKELPKLENIKDIPTLLDRMAVWGRNAYKASGGIKSGAKSTLYDTYYKAGLEILKDQAPEVYKYRSLLRFGYEIPSGVGKILWYGTLGRFLGGI